MSQPPLSPVRRAARLLRLLRERPHLLSELHDLLAVSPAQLRRDLDELGAEGWIVEGTGRPKTVQLVSEPPGA